MMMMRAYFLLACRCSAMSITFVNFVTCPVRKVVPVDHFIWEDVNNIKKVIGENHVVDDCFDCDDCEW